MAEGEASAAELSLEKYDFGSEISVEILCRSVTTHFEAVKSSSSQLDGTGYRTSAASRLLCWFISSHLELFKTSCDVIELGAGQGLTGIAAASALDCSSLAVLTDGEESVLDLLRQNIARNGLEAQAQALRLEWGETVASVREALEQHRQRQDPSSSYLPRRLVVLGSDLVYYPKAIQKLMQTIALLLSMEQSDASKLENEAQSCCFIAFTPRWSGWPEEMQASCEKHGLEIRRVLHEEALQTSSSREDAANGWFANTRFIVIFRKGQHIPATFVRPENMTAHLVDEEDTDSSADFLRVITGL